MIFFYLIILISVISAVSVYYQLYQIVFLLLSECQHLKTSNVSVIQEIICQARLGSMAAAAIFDILLVTGISTAVPQQCRHEKRLKMSANWIFKRENIHIITPKKLPILSIQHRLVHIMCIYPYPRVSICPHWAGFSTVNLVIQTQCGLFHKAKTYYALFWIKMSTF